MARRVQGGHIVGVNRDSFEAYTGVPVEEADGLLQAVHDTAGTVLARRSKGSSVGSQTSALQNYQLAVMRIFDKLNPVADVVEAATAVKIGDLAFSMNNLLIAVRNPEYRGPTTTRTVHSNGRESFDTDWMNANHLPEYLDKTPQEIAEDPTLGQTLAVDIHFHL